MHRQDALLANLDGRDDFYQEIVESSTDLICRVDDGGVLNFVNEAACRFFGKTRDALLGRAIDELVSQPENSQLREFFAGMSPGMAPLTVDEKLADAGGSYRWIQWTSMPLKRASGEPDGYLATGRDITARMNAERTLSRLVELLAPKTGSEFFCTLVKHLTRVCEVEYAIAGELDPRNAGRIKSIAFAQRGEIQPSVSYDLEGTPCDDLLTREFCCIADGAPEAYPDDAMLEELGIRSYIGVPLRTSRGKVLGLLSLFDRKPLSSDRIAHAAALLRLAATRVTAEIERQRADEALGESQHQLAAIAATMPQALYVFDIKTKQNIYANRAVAEDLGYTKEEIEEMGPAFLQQLLHPEDLKQMPELLARWDTVKDGEVLEVEYRMRAADGSWRWMIGRDAVFKRDADGSVRQIIGTASDVTNRKRAEENRRKMEARVLHAQKLESLGVLAGGVAHDFNNMLTVILSYTGLAESHTEADSPVRPMLGEIVHACQRAGDLTKQMLAYAGQGRFVVEPMRLDGLLEEMAALMRRVVPISIAIQSKTSPATINGDPTQMRQVIMNLIKNAADASAPPLDGQICLEAGVRWIAPDEVTGHVFSSTSPDGESCAFSPGNFAFLRVKDNGCGLAPERIAKIFDPFYSTKPTGQGLGLAASLGIVRSHAGAIIVNSKPMVGTTFEVVIPIAEPALKRQPEDATSTVSKGQMVLMIDDEPQICDVAKQILPSAGLQVTTASSGPEALELLSVAESEFAAIILDLRMPEMTGGEVLKELRKFTKAPVVIISGCPENEVEELLAGERVEGKVDKPFTPKELLNTVLQVLASRYVSA